MKKIKVKQGWFNEKKQNGTTINSIVPGLPNVWGQRWDLPPAPSRTAGIFACTINRLTRMYRLENQINMTMECRVGPYFIDIALFNETMKMAIEVDFPGKIIDTKRDRYLQNRGWIVHHISVDIIDQEREKVERARQIINSFVITEAK